MAQPSINNSQSGTGASSVSFSHTVSSNNNRLLLAFLAARDAANLRTVTASTYKAVSLTKLASGNHGSHQAFYELWYLKEPATGANTFSMTLSGTCNLNVAVLDLYNVDQASPFYDTTESTDAINQSVNVDVNSTVETLILGMLSKKANDTPSSNADQTRLITALDVDSLCLVDSKVGEGDGSTNIGYTWGANRYRVMIGAAIMYKAPGPPGVKTVNGKAVADIKTWQGIPIGDVKSAQGLT